MLSYEEVRGGNCWAIKTVGVVRCWAIKTVGVVRCWAIKTVGVVRWSAIKTGGMVRCWANKKVRVVEVLGCYERFFVKKKKLISCPSFSMVMTNLHISSVVSPHAGDECSFGSVCPFALSVGILCCWFSCCSCHPPPLTRV